MGGGGGGGGGGGTLAGIQIRCFVNLTFYVFQTAVESELELVRTQMKDKSEQHQTLQTVCGTCGLWEWDQARWV